MGFVQNSKHEINATDVHASLQDSPVVGHSPAISNDTPLSVLQEEWLKRLASLRATEINSDSVIQTATAATNTILGPSIWTKLSNRLPSTSRFTAAFLDGTVMFIASVTLCAIAELARSGSVYSHGGTYDFAWWSAGFAIFTAFIRKQSFFVCRRGC